MKALILPGDPLFDFTLGTTPPPNWREAANRDQNTYAFVAEPVSGIMRPATLAELEDYLNGGEYDDRLNEIGEDDDLDIGEDDDLDIGEDDDLDIGEDDDLDDALD